MNDYWITCKPQRGLDELADILPIIKNGRGYVAGSYAAWMTGRPGAVKPSDIDIFPTTDTYWEETAKILGIMKGCPAEGGDLVKIVDCRPLPIQIIRPNPKWNRFPDDLMGDFDLTSCRACLIDADTLIIDEMAGETQGKLLRINSPLRSLKRVMKYAARGTTFTDWELLKLFRAWEELSPEHRQTVLNAAEDEAFPSYGAAMDDHYTYDDDEWFEGE